LKRTGRSTALVRFRMNDYSAPAAYGFRDVLVKSFVDEVVEDFSAIRPHDGLNMMAYEKIGEISVAKILRAFIGDEVLSGTDIGAGQFWGGLAGLVGKFAPRIFDQLRFRDELQEKIDEYHRGPFDPAGRL
jgi:hypothetical protein